MTTRRRHTTRLMAAALMVGFLATSLGAGSAHAQELRAPTPQELTAHPAGARVRAHGRPVTGAGSVLYSYDVTYPAEPDLFAGYVIDVTPSHGAALAVNGAIFRTAQKPVEGGRVVASHARGGWFAGEDGPEGCRMVAGSTSGRVAFVVTEFGPAHECERLTPRLLALMRSLIVPLAIAQL